MDHLFFLKVENDICSAQVTKLDHPYHQLYHVLFEDGYENNFFTDAETGNWVEEDLGETTLAGNFGTKLYLLNGTMGLHRKTLSWCKASLAEEIISFGFYTYRENSETIFEVYASNRKFLYTFKNSKRRWRVYGPHYLIAADQYTNQVKIIISIFKGLAGCL
jgi:hypothetical protein